MDHHRTVGPIKGSGPAADTAFGELVIPQITAIVGTLDHYVAPKADHVVHWVTGMAGIRCRKLMRQANSPRPWGFMPVVPSLSTCANPWDYDREMYKKQNGVERLFRRLKGYSCIFPRFEKLNVLFLGFIPFALALDALR